eukprot:1161220-Pelagomonas_calceolata.AAC.28
MPARQTFTDCAHVSEPVHRRIPGHASAAPTLSSAIGFTLAGRPRGEAIAAGALHGVRAKDDQWKNERAH